MASGIGSAIIDFGAHPGSNEASVVVDAASDSIAATSKVDAFIMGDDTTNDHTAKDHRYLASMVGITCGTPVAATGFTIYVTSQHKLTGTYQLHWVWAD